MENKGNHTTVTDDRTLLADELEKAGSYFYTDYRRSMEHSSNALSLAKKVGDVSAEMRLCAMLAYNLARVGEFKRAFHFFSKGLELEPQVADPFFKSILFVNAGDAHRLQGKNDLAMEFYHKALHYKVKPHLGVIYNNIGSIYTKYEKYEKALKYLNLSLKEKLMAGRDLSDTYSNLGALFIKMDDLEKAQEYLSKGLWLTRQSNLKDSEISLLELSGMLCQLKGEIEQALCYFRQAKDLAEEIGFMKKVVDLHFQIGRAYEPMQEKHLAIASFKEGMELAVRLGVMKEGFKCMERLDVIYREAGNYEEAYKYSYAMLSAMRNRTFSDEEKDVYEIIENKEHQIDVLTDNNKEIARQNEALGRQNSELRQYAYIIAHDLREPLRTISSFSTLLKRRLGDSLGNDARDYLGFIKSGVERMDSLMKDLLIYASLDESSLANRRIHSIGEIIEDILVKFDNSQSQVDVDVDVDVELDVMPALHCHYRQIKQVFYQLISNAVKYRHRERFCEIWISVRELEDFYEFRVRDNGVGISEKHLRSIFLLFRKIERNGIGTGAGLPIAKKIVETHGGQIWVESDGESGSTFVFTLPRAASVGRPE